MRGKTTFNIAHRVSRITKVDLILAIDEGKVIEQGSTLSYGKRQRL